MMSVAHSFRRFVNILNKKDYINVSEKNKKSYDAAELALLCRKVIDAGKAENIIQLEVTELSVIADYFIICTAHSDPHLRALSERLKREVSRGCGFKPRFDGAPASQWVVVDFGNVVVHIFTPETREHYQLEALWSDAPTTEHIEKLVNVTKSV